MTENDKEISDYMTFPKTFEKYRWYKPILVFVLGVILLFILDIIVTVACTGAFGWDSITAVLNGGYEVLNTEVGEIVTDLGVIIMIPALYLATKIVRDRPFSSYASSRGGWNSRLYLKAFILPFILYIIFGLVSLLFEKPEGTMHFSILFLIITLILVPLQCIAEEYVFRGLIMQTFGSWFNIPILAIILQAIVFAVGHSYDIMGIIGIFVSGLVYGFLTWKTNGIEVSSALHTANNLSISLFVMFGITTTSSTTELPDFIISIAFSVFLLIVTYYVGKKTNWYGEIEENTQDA
ncbi:CPBP family intramembrane glutamic endopeptidase [Methanobrevibacter sp.]|uniref:CPBP family intramembrane glutamic endopeptidase n=1 Tax=Methanobrevibacter sp. TaxID=66852 RepID=UPI003864F7B2